MVVSQQRIVLYCVSVFQFCILHEFYSSYLSSYFLVQILCNCTLVDFSGNYTFLSFTFTLYMQNCTFIPYSRTKFR